ncbi:kinesin [Trypanosoma rangeli]|uniref:Kinesin n=1 Tax=Trypanosoma rangeli TaxID=5698 RepID=A0A422NJE0_TRYRA|nr:kinesin [Trypanosoma rangeli]RNF05561.1 kinesin [Trypanosoma rangeli]|eukprot:RNF05561.1 kinesin [Trypanosoma rangeli]
MTLEMDKAAAAEVGARVNDKHGTSSSGERPAGEEEDETPSLTLSHIMYGLPCNHEEDDGAIYDTTKKDSPHKLLEVLRKNGMEAACVQSEHVKYTTFLREERRERERIEDFFLEERHKLLEVETQLHSMSPLHESLVTPNGGACSQGYADTPDWFVRRPSRRTHYSHRSDAGSRTLWRRRVADAPWWQPRHSTNVLGVLSACVPFIHQRKDNILERDGVPTDESLSCCGTSAPPSSYTGLIPTIASEDDGNGGNDDDRSDAEEVTSLDSPCHFMADRSSMVRLLEQYGVEDMIQP